MLDLGDATHAYSFWEGVTDSGKKAFGQLFQKSLTMKAVAVVQRSMRRSPQLIMQELGFGDVTLLAHFPVNMSGAWMHGSIGD